MRRTRRLWLFGVVSALVFAAAAPLASADKPIRFPVDNVDVVLPPGAGCPDFTMTWTVDVDRQMFHIFVDKDGNPVRGSASGLVLLTVTNVEAQKSLVFREGGASHFTFDPDGATRFIVTGHALVAFCPTDIPPGPWTALTAGRTEISISPEDVWTLTSQTGRVIDVCAALAE